MSIDDESSREKSYKIFRRLLAYLRPYRKRFIFALLAMVGYGASEGLIPYLLKRILDDVFGNQNSDMLYVLVVAIIGFSIVRGLLGFFQRYLAAFVGLKIIEDIRNQIIDRLLYLPSSFYSKTSSGSLISRMTNDTLLIKSALTDGASALLRDSVRIVALVSVALYLDPVLGLIAVLGFPIGLLPVLKFGKKVRRLSRVGQDKFGGLTSLLHELIVGHKVVKSFAMEDVEKDKFSKENESTTQTFQKAEKYGALSGPSNEFLGSVLIGLIILYGGVSVISGVRTQGDFIAFITAMFLLYEPLKKIGRVNNTIQIGVSAAERVFEVIDTESEIVESANPVHLRTEHPEIVYNDVWFRYQPGPVTSEEVGQSLGDDITTDEGSEQSRWALKGVSLRIGAGEKIALVGMSGGGKSTFVNLLPRFFDPSKGSVSIDGVDLRDFNLKSLRQSVAMVSQHTFLFNDTVLANISYGRRGASEAEVVQAAKAANAHDFIMNLPDAYQTLVGEQGLLLSGGERARLAIARALLKDAPILVLDEATASLDSESEMLVQEAVERLMRNRTVLMIAHRLATVRNADSIAVFRKGELVEFGSHERLLESGGEYAKLYRLQFEDSTKLEAREFNS
ncbi:hypothetical protein BVY02_02580 [bacterium J17]|nr:hypothetical protein BVY02_02580 [bacterium J17]